MYRMQEKEGGNSGRASTDLVYVVNMKYAKEMI